VIGGKASVISRVPVLRGDHQIETIDQRIGHLHGLVSAGHGQCSPGQKVVLQINEDECSGPSARRSW
jgi:hypothetical protein